MQTMEAKSNRELKSYNVPFSICLHLWTSDGELNFSEVALALIHDNLLVVLFHLHLPLLTGLEVVDEWGLEIIKIIKYRSNQNYMLTYL